MKEEEARKDAVEAANDVTKSKGGLTSITRNLMYHDMGGKKSSEEEASGPAAAAKKADDQSPASLQETARLPPVPARVAPCVQLLVLCRTALSRTRCVCTIHPNGNEMRDVAPFDRALHQAGPRPRKEEIAAANGGAEKEERTRSGECCAAIRFSGDSCFVASLRLGSRPYETMLTRGPLRVLCVSCRTRLSTPARPQKKAFPTPRRVTWRERPNVRPGRCQKWKTD